MKTNDKVTPQEVMQKGGRWLGALREGIQWNCIRGDSVTWGSNDPLNGLTVIKLEEMIAQVVASDRNEQAQKRIVDAEGYINKRKIRQQCLTGNIDLSDNP